MESTSDSLDRSTKWIAMLPWLIALLFWSAGCASLAPGMKPTLENYTLTYDAMTDPALQAKLEALDVNLRSRHGINTQQAAVGVLDLKTLRLAMIHPDRIEYAASVPKIGI